MTPSTRLLLGHWIQLTLSTVAQVRSLTASLGAESIHISNVETIKLTATGALTIDARDISGVSKYANESSSNDLTLNNLGEIPTLDLNTIVDDVTVNFADATLLALRTQ